MSLILEDILLDVTSSNAVDGIFYCCSMKINIGNKLLHVARFFEYGAFAVLFSSKGHDTLKEYLQLDQLRYHIQFMLKKMSRQIEKELKNYMRRGRNRDLFFHSFVLVSFFRTF